MVKGDDIEYDKRLRKWFFKAKEQEIEINNLKESLAQYVEMTSRILSGKVVREYDHKKERAERLLHNSK